MSAVNYADLFDLCVYDRLCIVVCKRYARKGQKRIESAERIRRLLHLSKMLGAKCFELCKYLLFKCVCVGFCRQNFLFNLFEFLSYVSLAADKRLFALIAIRHFVDKGF